MNRGHTDKRLNQLPTWLWTNSTTLPPIYKMVWEAVREDKLRTNGMQTELLVDTNKVFPLLLTSQLPTEVLGHIWNLANQKYAGQLTEQELYIVLALVAAAQASYTFNSLDILHLLPFPPTPYLNIECLLNLQPVMRSNSAAKYQGFSAEKVEIGFGRSEERYSMDAKGKCRGNEGNAQPPTDIPGKVSSLDSKSNPASTIVWDLNLKDNKQTRRSHLDIKQSGLASDPGDDFSEFQSAPIPNIPSVPIWDTKQGSAIGSRLANHNLGVKKPSVEKVKKNTINAKAGHGGAEMHAPSVHLNSMGQNKDKSVDCLSELFPKCAIKNQSKTVILKDTAIRSNDLPKDYGESVKERTINASEGLQSSNDRGSVVKLEWAEKVVGAGTEASQLDLMNLQSVEDKYSALRALVQQTSASVESNPGTRTVPGQSMDEFGEFVSAEQPPSTVQAAVSSGAGTLDRDRFADVFTEFELKSGNENSNVIDLSLMPDISESLDNLKLEDAAEERSLDVGKIVQKEDAISINSIEFMNGASGALTRSGSVPSLDLKSFLPSSTEEEQPVDASSQPVYWEWKQYMESCVLLLQVAANIFTGISSEVVLQEVLNSAQGYNFLCNLAEVAAVCRRVNFSYKEMDINIIGFDELLMDIDRIWAEMEPFYANIPIVTELPAWPLHQGESISCALCLTVITSGRVLYNENNYHVTCANLWLNRVNNHLPAMRHPPFCSHSAICSGNSHI